MVHDGDSRSKGSIYQWTLINRPTLTLPSPHPFSQATAHPFQFSLHDKALLAIAYLGSYSFSTLADHRDSPLGTLFRGSTTDHPLPRSPLPSPLSISPSVRFSLVTFLFPAFSDLGPPARKDFSLFFPFFSFFLSLSFSLALLSRSPLFVESERKLVSPTDERNKKEKCWREPVLADGPRDRDNKDLRGPKHSSWAFSWDRYNHNDTFPRPL